jgi:FKBP-type peptidyl-prolyl cis-trans isomerase
MNKKVKGVIVACGVVAVAVVIAIVFALQAKAPTKENEAVKKTSNEGVKTMDNQSLQSTDEVMGTGTEAKVDDNITVKYTGTLADGTVFDSTEKQGGQPITFQLSKGKLIDGWVQGIPGMKVGGKRKLVIPPSLAYGDRSVGSIPPNSTLTFVIELVEVK